MRRNRNPGYMKVRGLLAACVTALLVTSAFWGCASTPEHRSAGEVIDDAGIHARIKAKLIDDDRVDANEVNVEVKRGVVTLLGWVTDAEERRAAGEIAASVPGVRRVENHLHLKSELKK